MWNECTDKKLSEMRALKYVCICLIFCGFATQTQAQCDIAAPVPIYDLSTQFGHIWIENALVNDLSAPGQGICQIDIRFKHASIGDVNLYLTAPSGTRYHLIKSGGSRVTAGTQWNISLVRCNDAADPDQGNFIKPVWDSDQDWGEDKHYVGSYYAETCLETINNGPVNGIWTIMANDDTGTGTGEIESFGIKFCNQSGINCGECKRLGGTLPRDTTYVCGGDPKLGNIRIFPTYSGEEPDPAFYDYRFIVINNGSIHQISQRPDLETAPKGDYLIYGISVAKQDLDRLLAFEGKSYAALANAINVSRLSICAALSNGFKLYRILSDPNPKTVVNRFVCDAAPFKFGEDTIRRPGVYTATLISQSGCDSVVEMHVTAFDIQSPIVTQGVITCTNKPYYLRWENNLFEDDPSYRWSTHDGSVLSGERTATIQADLPGRYDLIIAKDGCADTLSTQVTSDASLPTLLVHDIVMDCSATIGELRPESNGTGFTWTGPFGYSATTPNIDVTEPGEYTITAIGDQCAVRKRVVVSADFARPEDVEVAGGTLRCAYDSVQITASSSSEGVEYVWSGPDGFSSGEQNPVVRTPGLYNVRIGIPGSSCTEELQVSVINLFAEPSISITGTTLDCRSLRKRISTTLNDNQASYQWTGPNNFSSFEKSPLVELPGKYDVVIYDANQCYYEASATVSLDTVMPTISTSDIHLGCQQNEFTLGATYSSLHPAKFTWTGPNNFVSNQLDAKGTQAGSYTLRVADPVNGCAVSATVQVIPDPDQPVLRTESSRLNCDRPRDTLLVDATCAGGCDYLWEGPNGITDNDQSIEIDQSGQYKVKVTDLITGCYSWGSFQVNLDTAPVAKDVEIVPIGCTTQGRLVLKNDHLLREFFWIDSITGDSIFDPSLDISRPTTYSLHSIDINGCGDIHGYRVNRRDDAPDLSIDAGILDCAHDTVGVGASVSNYPVRDILSYSWSLPGGGTSQKVTPRVGMPGAVTLQVEMRNGCNGSASSVITTDYSEPEVEALGGALACDDPGIYLSIADDEPFLSVLWSGPNGFQSFEPNPLATIHGVYTLLLQGTNGCTATDTANVYYKDPLPSVSLIADTITCHDPIGQLSFETNAQPGFSYRWFDPGGRINLDRDIQTTLVGPYQLEVTDINGCRGIGSTFIQIDTITFGHEVTSTLVSCNIPTSQLLLDTIYPFLRYDWTYDSTAVPVAAEPQPTVTRGGLYTLITTNTNGCQKFIPHIVEADTLLPVFALMDDTLNCENTRISLSPTPVLSGWTYAWSGPAGFTSDRRSPLIIDPGLYTVEVTATNGCKDQRNSLISASFEPPQIDVHHTFIPCNGKAALLSISTSDTLRETNWFGPAGYYRNTVFDSTRNAGWYYILSKGLNGCEVFDSLQVLQSPDLAPLELDAQVINCTYDTGFVRVLNVSPEFSYAIIDQTNAITEAAEIETIAPNTFIVSAEHLASSCITADTVTISVDTIQPVVDIIENDSIVCEHREIRLGSSVDTTVTFQWSTDDGHLVGSTTGDVARLDEPGMYHLTVKSVTNGCLATASIAIDEKVSNLDRLFLRTLPATCDGEDNGAIVIDSVYGGTAPYKYSLNNDYYTSTESFLYLQPGDYQVFVKDVNGCIHDTIFDLQRVPGFEVELGERDLHINLGDTVDLSASVSLPSYEIGDLVWNSPDSSSCMHCMKRKVRPVLNTEYVFNVTSVLGCTISDTVFVRVSDPGGIYVPNAFTPDHDGVNDYFEIFTGPNIERIVLFKIYDRWGNNVFTASDFSPGDLGGRWDGTYNNTPLDPDVFVYQAKAIDLRGNIKSAEGDLTLIR